MSNDCHVHPVKYASCGQTSSTTIGYMPHELDQRENCDKSETQETTLKNQSKKRIPVSTNRCPVGSPNISSNNVIPNGCRQTTSFRLRQPPPPPPKQIKPYNRSKSRRKIIIPGNLLGILGAFFAYSLVSFIVTHHFFLPAMSSSSSNQFEQQQQQLMKDSERQLFFSSSTTSTSLLRGNRLTLDGGSHNISRSNVNPNSVDKNAEIGSAVSDLVGPCAINLYGLPRSFKDLVLPSLKENVIQVNARYRCDYFVHYNDRGNSEEPPGRDGRGGAVHADEILLLKDAVLNLDRKLWLQNKQQHFENQQKQQQQQRDKGTFNSVDQGTIANDTNTAPMPQQLEYDAYSPVRVVFAKDTDESFFAKRGAFLHTLKTARINTDSSFAKNAKITSTSRLHDLLHPNKEGRLVYMPTNHPDFTNETIENIVKMWHGQQTVWDLMNNVSRSSSSTMPTHYSRVAMLRCDVVYVTPLDIYAVPAAAAFKAAKKNEQQKQGQYDKNEHQQRKNLDSFLPVFNGNDTSDRSRGDKDQHVHYDVANEFAVIPGFAKHPVNDRYIAGPYDAVRLWAAARFELLDRHITEIVNPYYPGDGIHSERFLAFTIFPAISINAGVPIIEDNTICFLRARADCSIRLDDCGYQYATPNNHKAIEQIIQRDCFKNVSGHLVFLDCSSSSSKTIVSSNSSVNGFGRQKGVDEQYHQNGERLHWKWEGGYSWPWQ